MNHIHLSFVQMNRRRDFAWPSFLIHRPNTQPRGHFCSSSKRERERRGRFPVELGESNKRVVQNYSTPSRRIYTSTVTALGGKRHSPEQCSPKCPCSSPASSIFFLRDTAEDNKCIRIPNFSYTEFHPPRYTPAGVILDREGN